MLLPPPRVKKLRDTFVIIQSLDKNMSNLRTWLARIEGELSKPVIYDICDDQEIQRKLAEHQDLQTDIEQHNADVASVLNICDVLLHDSDACANETECDSIHQTTRSLDRRWRNICSLSMERRMKIEETWRLWQRFLEDYSRFEEWLNAAEKTAAFPNSAEVLYTNAKEELKKFEAFQRQIHERLTQLELINKQYRRLARENRTDSASKLKQKVHEGNQRWDALQKRVAAILRRLRAFEDEKETSENELESDESREMSNAPWRGNDSLELPQPSLAHLMPPAPEHEQSGRETPVSVDSIPLEWDHTVDVGGSSSHEDDDEDEGEGAYYSALSVRPDDNEAPRKQTFKPTAVFVPPPGSPPDAGSSVNRRHLLETIATGDGNGVQHEPSEERQEEEGLVSLEVPDRQSGIIERWEILQAQALSNEFQKKQSQQRWQQLKADLAAITEWLESTEANLDELWKEKPANSIEETQAKVKELKDIVKAFDNHKALVISANLSSKDFQDADSAESKELQNRLRQVNLRWEKACSCRDTWRERLQHDLMHCQHFHKTSHSLLLWLESAEKRRLRAQILDPHADPHTVLECQKELRQLEKELLEQRPQVNSLQEIAKCLLGNPDEQEYVEADERVHVIASKLGQLLEQVSQDLKTAQDTLDMNTFASLDKVDSKGHISPLLGQKIGEENISQEKNEDHSRAAKQSEVTEEGSRPRSIFYRVLRAALPLQFLLLLLLLLAFLLPFSEEDYSCANSNNFKRSFYPMLRYTNGPPPT